MLDTETHLKFGTTISTEDRFKFRNWLEGWFFSLSENSLQDVWSRGLTENFQVDGLSEQVWGKTQFLEYVAKQHAAGSFMIRVPSGSVEKVDDLTWHLQGELEIFTDNLLSCAGIVQIVLQSIEGDFKVKTMHLEPRLRVNI